MNSSGHGMSGSRKSCTASRARLGEAWLDCYLTMPIWRFVLLPGLVGPSGWAGVLMPSVDRVGRHFPLTLAVELSSGVAAAAAVFEGADWFARLEEVALTVLDPTRDVESFDRSLVDHVFTSPKPAEVDGQGGAVRRLSSVEEFSSRAKAEALASLGTARRVERALVDRGPGRWRPPDASLRGAANARGVRRTHAGWFGLDRQQHACGSRFP